MVYHFRNRHGFTDAPTPHSSACGIPTASVGRTSRRSSRPRPSDREHPSAACGVNGVELVVTESGDPMPSPLLAHGFPEARIVARINEPLAAAGYQFWRRINGLRALERTALCRRVTASSNSR